MIRVLKALVNWLEKRFPEKLVVTEREYTALKSDIQALQVTAREHAAIAERVKRVEEHLSKMNLVLGIASGTATLER